MELSLQDLSLLVGGSLDSPADGGRIIRSVAGISEAGEGDLTFLGSSRYLSALRCSGASAALVPMDFQEAVGPVVIRVDNPSQAFSLVVQRFAPAPVKWAPGVHPTAVIGGGVILGEGVSIQPYVVVEDGAKIGDRTVVGAHSYVGHGARIGADCRLAARVTIGEHCVVGDRAIFHSGVVLGSDGFGFEFSGGRHLKIPQTGIVQVDDDVEIGANSTVDRARFGRTWIGAGTKIDNLVQVAHNVVMGKHCIIVSQTGIAGSARLGNYVTMAGQSATAGHVVLGDQVVVAARGGVTKNIPAKEQVWGVPAIPIREAKEQIASVRRLPKLEERVRALEKRIGRDSAAG